jgi:DNA-binding GntR family transcriptional regulator
MQLQSAIANNDYQKAQDLRQRISQILQSLQDSKYQNAADTASQLDPSLLSGTALDVAQELQNRLRNLEGINAFQNYLQSLQKYMDALRLLEQGDREGAAQIINEELGNLEQYQGGDPELQGLYGGLREAFMHLRDPPKQG